jgi:hypothetical protein
MKLTRENRQLGEKPVPVPLCPPQTPHGLTRESCFLIQTNVGGTVQEDTDNNFSPKIMVTNISEKLVITVPYQWLLQ